MLSFVRSLMACCVVLCGLSVQAHTAPLVLFDESHAQQFKIGKEGPLDLSGLAQLLRENGYSVESLSEPLTPDALAAANILVISGPFKALDGQELEAVMDFIDSGGGLALMLHIAPPARDLMHRLDVDYTNGTLRETTGVIGGNPLNFRVENFAEHPLTSDLEAFSVYGSWALRATASHVSILAETTRHGWVDLDQNNQLSKNDAMQTFGVLAAGELGQGRYVVLGDDAVFQNQFLDSDNRKLAINMMNWLSSK